jgi:hypothetical protein
MTGLQMLLGGGGLTAMGGFSGLFKSVIGVNDAMITSSGKVIKFNSADDILASKDMSSVFAGSGGTQHVVVTGKISGQDIFVSNARGGSSYDR